MSKTGIDRRIHPRLGLSLPVRVSSIDPETDASTRRPFFRATRAWCVNLSRGGIFVHTPEPFGSGRRVLVEITLPDGRSFDSVGRVAWVQRSIAPGGDGEGIGIEFLATAPSDVAALDRALRDAQGGRADAHRFVV